MIVYFLSVLDIISSVWYFLGINFFLLTFGLIVFLKGLIGFLSSISMRYYYDWMGAIDILAGLVIILSSFSVSIPYGKDIVLLLAIKGTYTFVRHLLKI